MGKGQVGDVRQHQHAAVGDDDVDEVFCGFPAPQTELAGFAEADGDDRRALEQLLFIVSVRADVMLQGAVVPIQQQAIQLPVDRRRDELREVSEATGVGRTQASEDVRRAAVVGVTWPVPDEVDDPNSIDGGFPFPTTAPDNHIEIADHFCSVATATLQLPSICRL